MAERFSDRHGYRGAEQEISVREDAPDGLRYAIPLMAQDAGMTPTVMRRVICQVLLVPPDRNNWSDYPNIWDEVTGLLSDCPWYKIYDIAEALHAGLAQAFNDNSGMFAQRLNQYFAENGIGWQLQDGKIMYRGSEAFTGATRQAVEVLRQTGRTVSANEIHEALTDISRRPKPDVTGAIQHVIAAMEGVARDVTGDPNATFGKLVGRLNLTPPLDKGAEKLWGYASERARHVREGQDVTDTEAELIVSVSCAICTYLAKRVTH